MKEKVIIQNKFRVCIMCIFFILIFLCNSNCYGYSENFKFIIDTVGIPEKNKNGENINEEIYIIYKVFVYSDPVSMINKTNLQRFKEVEDKGKWIKEDTNKRGEYYILGTDYNGNYVTNVYFPVDFIPETLPTSWNYLYSENAINSWNDKSKYKYLEQLEYMKNTNILFDNIDFENNICDSYDLVEYDINANKIGLDKAMLETCSTWTTSGVINVKRLTPDNKVRYATFFVKPMAASADIESFLDVEEKIYIKNNVINIKFGANVINLNNYAKEEHIKEINSEIYINDIKIDTVKSTKIRTISKDVVYEIPKKYLDSDSKILNIKVKSYLYTEFYVDGLLQDVIEKNITIPQENIEDNIVPAHNILVKQLNKINNEFFVNDLIKTKVVENENSLGIIEKGKYMALKIDNINVETVDNIYVYINDIEYKTEIIGLNNNNVILKIKVVEKDTNENFNTIATWKYLKDLTNDYFNINFSNIGKRIKKPNVLKVIVNDNIYIFNFDVIDNYIYNMNYTFLDNVTNINKINEKIRLEKWD